MCDYFEGCGIEIKGCGIFGTHNLWDDRLKKVGLHFFI